MSPSVVELDESEDDKSETNSEARHSKDETPIPTDPPSQQQLNKKHRQRSHPKHGSHTAQKKAEQTKILPIKRLRPQPKNGERYCVYIGKRERDQPQEALPDSKRRLVRPIIHHIPHLAT